MPRSLKEKLANQFILLLRSIELAKRKHNKFLFKFITYFWNILLEYFIGILNNVVTQPL